MKTINLASNKKVYFASDFHLGIDAVLTSRQREITICQWLDKIKTDAQELFLVGDLFDVWFEYKSVIPKGFSRFFGKLAELSDSGVQISIFTGNHDFWMNDYFQKEFNIPVYTQEIEIKINNKIFRIGHGDGLGPGDTGYKILKKILSNSICQFLYKALHPTIGIGLAKWFSEKGTKHNGEFKEKYFGQDQEYLIQYATQTLKTEPVNFFIYGHRHLPIVFTFQNQSQYINLGDWIQYQSYATFDGSHCQLFSNLNQYQDFIIDNER